MSYTPSLDKVLLDGSPRLLDFPASAGAFAPSMLSQILIPSAGSRYILGGSAYLNFDVALSATVTSVGTPPILAYFSGGPTKSAAALIDRITISAGGTTLADIGNYYVWHNMILLHASSQDYQQSSQILENSFQSIAYAGAPTSVTGSVTISLPLAVGIFNTTKAFPLWAFNAPLVINIYWNSFAKSIGYAPIQQSALSTAVSALNGITGNWTGSGLSLRCACVDVDPEYIIQQKKQMAAGKLLVFQYDQASGMQTNAGPSSINFGVNCSSLLGVFGTQQINSECAQLASGGAEGLGYTVSAGSWGFSANYADSIRVFRDGTQLSSFPLCVSTRDDAYPALQQALGVLFSTSNATLCRKIAPDSYTAMSGANYRLDSSITQCKKFNLPPAWSSGTYQGGSVFQPCGFVWGLSARKCSDDNVSNQGVYCQQLQVTVDNGGTTAGTHYIYYVYSSALAIDVAGNCVVKR